MEMIRKRKMIMKVICRLGDVEYLTVYDLVAQLFPVN
jgi:hypothetical protein